MNLVSSIVLLIQDNEVNYNLYMNPDGNGYFFKPVVYMSRNVVPPSFWVYKKGSAWNFEGFVEKEIRGQAIDEISFYLDYSTTDLSAIND